MKIIYGEIENVHLRINNDISIIIEWTNAITFVILHECHGRIIIHDEIWIRNLSSNVEYELQWSPQHVCCLYDMLPVYDHGTLLLHMRNLDKACLFIESNFAQESAQRVKKITNSSMRSSATELYVH